MTKPIGPSAGERRLRRLRWLLAALSLTAVSAQGADSAPSPAAAASPLAGARGQIEARNWAGALSELRRVDARTSADWNNLMGYVLRKQSSPDFDAAERHYREALRIDPAHRGAHEYLGELFLMKGDLKGAEGELAALDKLCLLPCEEYTDLKKAVERYKANGNRYVAP